MSRTVDGVTTALTWDVTSSLTESDGQGGHVVYACDASRQRGAQARVADGDGVGTATGDVTATRYYTFGGSTVAVRTNDGKLALMVGDEQGSTSVVMPVTVQAGGALASATLNDAATVTRTSYTPYGELRGEDNPAVDRGWLGQVEDRVSADGATGTGLTYLNARYYDPATQRFISPDPLMNPGDPKTLDPYRYADNNPVVFTDASGLTPNCWGRDSLSVNVCLATYESTHASKPSQRAKAKYFRDALVDASAQRSTGRRVQPSEREAAKEITVREVIRRAGREAGWRYDRDTRRSSQGSTQNTRDDLSGTSELEKSAAMSAIWNDGAKPYTKGPACGKLMECFVGGDFDFGTITLGHTVISGSQVGEKMASDTQAHEYAHVLDVEYAGAASFYSEYALWALPSMALNPSVGWHDSNYDESRGLAAENEYRASGNLVHFEKDDVTKNATCRAFFGGVRGLPKQSFG